MTKNFFLSVAILFLLGACAQPQENKESSQTANETTTNDLPLMQIDLLSGRSIQAKELDGKVMLILFQPDCDHCQHEAEAMGQRVEDFKAYDLYFLSSATPQEIERFSRDYKLNGQDNIHFGMVGFQAVLDNFGPIPAPSLYIYSDGKLLSKFNGQTDVGEIVEAL